ncbi:MAG: hypothetical protein AMXMBFR47_09990 [Planctomycetota bacterium]
MPDLQRENDNLRRILDVARYMAVTNDLDVLLGTIVEATCEVLSCERATIFLYDPARDELYSRVAKGVDAIRFPANLGIAGAAAKERVFINVPDAYADARFNRDVDRKTGFRTRNLLTFPLENIQGDLIGVLQALNKEGGPFDADDEQFARALAAQAGVALDRGRLLEQFAEKQRMEHDLDVARQIQQGLLPRENPRVDGYEIAGWNRSADETGGDCYDFFRMPDGRLAIFLADATGHGIGAALVIAQARALVRAMLKATQDLPKVVAGVNDLLSDDLSADQFVTAFLGILDPAANRLDYIANGQGPLMLVTATDCQVRPANSFPLAVIPGATFEAAEPFTFEPGATLVLLTDGFFEAADASAEQFGEERVVAHVRATTAEPLPNVITLLHEKLCRFAGKDDQVDDLTAVLVRRNP